jgi:tetratricopeptide (TPR) repeat protein
MTPSIKTLRCLLQAALAGLLLMGSAARADDAPDAASRLITEGEARMQAGDLDAAVATLQRAVAADPGSSLAHTRLGGALLLSQRHTEAIAEFQQALAEDADNAGAFIGLGLAYLHADQPGPARAALVEAKRLAPQRAAEIDDLIRRIDQAPSVPHGE